MVRRKSVRQKRKKAADEKDARKGVHDDIEISRPSIKERLDRVQKRAKLKKDAEAADPSSQSISDSMRIGRNKFKDLGVPTTMTAAVSLQSHPMEASAPAHPASFTVLSDSKEEPALIPRAKPVLGHCGVCRDSHPLTEFSTREGCRRLTNICHDCLADWICHKFDSRFEMLGNICPCSGRIARALLRKSQRSSVPHLSSTTDCPFWNACRKDPDFCDCLSGNCTGGHIHDSANGSLFEYGECHSRQCTTHNIPFNDGKMCEQYDQDKRREKLPETWRVFSSLVAAY